MKKGILFFIIIFYCLSGLAANTQPDALFNSKKANRTFDKISITLSTQNLSLNDLRRSVSQLNDLQDQAKECVSKSQEHINTIDKKLSTITAKAKPDQTPQADINFLQNKKEFYSKQLSECRLFIYRSDEALSAYVKTIQKISAHKILGRSTPIWKIIDKNTFHSLKKINGASLIKNSAISEVTTSKLFVGLGMLLLALIAGIVIRFRIKKYHSTFAKVAQTYISPFLILFASAVFCSIIFYKVSPIPSLELLSYFSLGYIILLAASQFIFRSMKTLGSQFYKRAIFLLSWLFIGAFLFSLFRELPFSKEFTDLIRAIFITVLAVLTAWFCWLVSQLDAIKQQHPKLNIAIKYLIGTLLITTLLTEWIGFHDLAVFLLLGTLLTILLAGVIITTWKLIRFVYQLLQGKQHRSGQWVRNKLGIKPHRYIPEIVLLKFVAYILLIYFSMPGLLSIWGGVHMADILIDRFDEGFLIGNLLFIPLKIILSIITFSLILLAGRFISNLIAKQQQHRNEAERQVAIASLMLYISFTIAVVFALIVAGVNLTGLAIIAGALSVGVGLGLQHIVENFASGLILLLEKPVKPGDRVVVGDVEGFIKKIRLRSTQITTLAKEDVIVPNSDLINNQVINYMFRDRLWRISCKVGVAYGSNVELVKKVLLELAEQHEQVVNDAPNEPRVLFREFGDSSLGFELWCIIKDVNEKYNVTSDLYSAIDAAFRKNNITIAFPQRDIHIKSE